MRHQPAPSSAIGEDCEEGKGENANIQIANVWKGMVELEVLMKYSLELVSHNTRH